MLKKNCGKVEKKLRNSTPRASKVHCSINRLEDSSSPEYSKVQHLFRIAVGLFLVGGGLRKSSPPAKKSPSPIEKSPPRCQFSSSPPRPSPSPLGLGLGVGQVHLPPLSAVGLGLGLGGLERSRPSPPPPTVSCRTYAKVGKNLRKR